MADFSGFLVGGRVRPAPGVAREVVSGALASMRLANCGAVPVYLGGSSGLTVANGFPLRVGESFAMSVAEFSSLFVVSDVVLPVVLPGSAGDYVHSPDSAAVSVAGDIDVRCHVALDTWGTTQQTLVSKYHTTANRSYRLIISTGGLLQFAVSSDGADYLSANSTAVVPFSDGAAGHVRATLDVDNGAAGRDYKFYTSSDGVSWSQLGDTVTTATAISIFDGTATLNVSGYNTGAEPVVGTVYSAQVFDGIRPDEGTDFWLDLPGGSGDYAHTPDSAAVSVTGDLDIRCHVALDDWTPAGTSTLVDKRSGGDDAYQLRVLTSGLLSMIWYTGSTYVQPASTVAPTVADGEPLHVRVTVDVDNGAAGNDVTFYTSVDGVVWSQLGDVVTTAGVSVIADTAWKLNIGASQGAGNVERMAGTVYSAQVYDGIDGTLVADFNPTRDSSGYGDASITSGTSGEVWTVAGAASVTGLVADLDPSRDSVPHAASVTSSTSGEVWTVAGDANVVASGCLDLPGASGDYAHSPDSAAVSITGDLDIRCHAALDDWTPAADSTLVAKWEDSGPNRSFLWRVKSNGTLELYVSSGTDYLVSVSSVAVPFANGEAGHVRVTLDVDDGASQRVSTFYTSTDGISWSQLGVPDTRSGAISIVDRTSLLTIGAMQDAGDESRTTGTVYSAQVYDGIEGTLVADFDPLRDAEAGDTTVTSASTGEVWTVAGNASVAAGSPAAVSRVLW